MAELLFLPANARQLPGESRVLLTYAVLVSQLVLFSSVLYITSTPLEVCMRILFAISFVDVFLYMAVDIRLMIGI